MNKVEIEITLRIKELEQIAKERFADNSSWEAVLQTLNKEERKELSLLTRLLKYYDKKKE